MDSLTTTSADQTPHASLAAAAQKTCSTECVPCSETPRLDEAQHRPWADLPADILGVVACRLALLEDRARLRSVCRAWRAAQHRPWADLPADILGVVAYRLVLLEDRARLRSVCRAWRTAQHRPWADLPADILGVVACPLALLEDRARLRSICRAWRAAARTHLRLPRPPPLLVLSDFSFFSFGADGTVTAERRRVPLPERETPASGCARCVGSFDEWLVGVKLNKGRYFGDLRCFLMNAFSQAVIRLPPPSGAARFADTFSTSLPIINGSGVVNCAIDAAPRVMSFTKVILSSSPDSGSRCVVAAVSKIKKDTKLALCRPGMKSWYVCDGAWTTDRVDIVFFQGKLFMLRFGDVSTELLAFEIADDDNNGLMVSHVECCAIAMPAASDSCYKRIWCIAEWRGKLLIVEKWHGRDGFGKNFVKVRVCEADLSTNPVRFTEIESLDGDCMFISWCGSKSFRSCHYGGGEGEGDLVYMFFGHCFQLVYNMKDGTTAPFAADITEDKLKGGDGKLMNSTWLFPPE